MKRLKRIFVKLLIAFAVPGSVYIMFNPKESPLPPWPLNMPLWCLLGVSLMMAIKPETPEEEDRLYWSAFSSLMLTGGTTEVSWRHVARAFLVFYALPAAIGAMFFVLSLYWPEVLGSKGRYREEVRLLSDFSQQSGLGLTLFLWVLIGSTLMSVGLWVAMLCSLIPTFSWKKRKEEKIEHTWPAPIGYSGIISTEYQTEGENPSQVPRSGPGEDKL